MLLTSARKSPKLVLALAVCTLAVWGPARVAFADDAKVTTRHKIAVPSLQRAASALSLSTAFAVGGKDLYEVDLKSDKAARYSGEAPKFAGYKDPVVSPNGKYLFLAGILEEMHRFGIK